MVNMESIIEIINVSKNFGDEHVLIDISHFFEKGKIHGIVGNNGSGKTVLMKCICGFLRLDSGRIIVNHQEVGKDRDFPDDIGIIIETPGFLPQLSGFQNLKILASLRKKADDDTIYRTIKHVGLDPEMRKPVSKYSLGMRQRLGLAQALMEDPGILVLDEPLNGLDKHGVIHIRNIIKDLRNMGKTVILASHNQVDIDELCDTVCEMDAGKLTVIR